jgi:uncharacterized protein DUF1016
VSDQADQAGRSLTTFSYAGLLGEELLKTLSRDLRQKLRRGFSKRNLELMRFFYLSWPSRQMVSAQFQSWPAFPLPCPTTFVRCRFPERTLANSMNAKLCRAAGRYANSTARLPAWPTNEPTERGRSHSRRTSSIPTPK